MKLKKAIKNSVRVLLFPSNTIQFMYLRPVVDAKRNTPHCNRVSSDEIPAEINLLQSV